MLVVGVFLSKDNMPSGFRKYGTRLGFQKGHNLNIGKNGKDNPAWKGGKIKRICQICGNEFMVTNQQIKKKFGKFCSYECAGIWRSKNKTGRNNDNWKPKIRCVCKICNKKYYLIPALVKNNKYCSKICHGIGNNINMKFKDTSIEILMEQELIKNKIPYMKQVPIGGIALVDFLLPNKIIIQCDGDYWHSKEINKGKDIAQDTVLIFKGYKVFRFWEYEINKSAKKCISKVMEQ